jgi:2-polyprenyl-6-methoxyphenol hydroxylase-like FAD-dependent oxidoreductase
MLVPAITPLAFSAATHDVLIVGGGTAGLTLAGRLSEDPSINVGVIEAGFEQFDNPEVNVNADVLVL